MAKNKLIPLILAAFAAAAPARAQSLDQNGFLDLTRQATEAMTRLNSALDALDKNLPPSASAVTGQDPTCFAVKERMSLDVAMGGQARHIYLYDVFQVKSTVLTSGRTVPDVVGDGQATVWYDDLASFQQAWPAEGGMPQDGPAASVLPLSVIGCAAGRAEAESTRDALNAAAASTLYAWIAETEFKAARSLGAPAPRP